MIINNVTKGVIVLKAIGMPNLRLFPGHNTVEKKGFDEYFTNPAAKAHREKNLTMPRSGDITPDEQRQADKAQEKNAQLNKAQRVVKAQSKVLAKNDKTMSEQAAVIKELRARMEDLEKKIKPEKVAP
ncbi:MAG: hypothetical protein DRH26_03500 [Deltaproteobacteria bacterium]|nr:MAG: hypothetical protein DRH26_03500 [Deltaproteobacteria bacterium]